jgi:MarR family transcriptional regulator for hemolysin
MLNHHLKSDAAHAMCMAARLFERAMADELGPQGITFRQCQVLAWLAIAGDLSQTELADNMNIEPQTLVSVLDRMERDGLVAREPCPEDRRKKLIRPKPKAKPVWKRIMQCADQVRATAFEGLSKSEVTNLKTLLDRVQANLARTN